MGTGWGPDDTVDAFSSRCPWYLTLQVTAHRPRFRQPSRPTSARGLWRCTDATYMAGDDDKPVRRPAPPQLNAWRDGGAHTPITRCSTRTRDFCRPFGSGAQSACEGDNRWSNDGGQKNSLRAERTDVPVPENPAAERGRHLTDPTPVRSRQAWTRTRAQDAFSPTWPRTARPHVPAPYKVTAFFRGHLVLFLRQKWAGRTRPVLPSVDPCPRCQSESSTKRGTCHVVNEEPRIRMGAASSARTRRRRSFVSRADPRPPGTTRGSSTSGKASTWKTAPWPRDAQVAFVGGRARNSG
jgi:hypothetical protein